jgi:hypothetical protein
VAHLGISSKMEVYVVMTDNFYNITQLEMPGDGSQGFGRGAQLKF